MRNYSYYREVGETIQRQRRRMSLSQEALSYISRVDRTYIARIEQGRANPSLKIITRLSRVLNIKLEEVLNV
jgi:ribosome-binding protein aMBF1 (putative translation factor)